MKKDNISKKLLALSLLSTLTLTHPESVEATQNYNRREVVEESIPTITALTNVNIRECASINSRKIGTLLANQSLRLYEETAQWYKVGYGNTFGYVNKQYAMITNKTVMHTPSIKTIVTANAATLYSDESCTNPIGIVPANSYINIYLDNAYTYYIYYNNLTGYVNKNLVNTKPYIYVNEPPVAPYVYVNEPPVAPYVYTNEPPTYVENNYYGPVENNYNYYYEDNSKVLVRK